MGSPERQPHEPQNNPWARAHPAGVYGINRVHHDDAALLHSLAVDLNNPVRAAALQRRRELITVEEDCVSFGRVLVEAAGETSGEPAPSDNAQTRELHVTNSLSEDIQVASVTWLYLLPGSAAWLSRRCIPADPIPLPCLQLTSASIMPDNGCFKLTAIPCRIIPKGQITLTVSLTPDADSAPANLSAWVVLRFEGPRVGTLDGWQSVSFVCVRPVRAFVYRAEDVVALDPTAAQFIPAAHRQVLTREPSHHRRIDRQVGLTERRTIQPFLGESLGAEYQLSSEEFARLVAEAERAHDQMTLTQASGMGENARSCLKHLFHLLLRLEETQILRDVQEYNLHDLQAKRVSHDRRTDEHRIKFVAPGVLENRPPVNIGDVVNLRYLQAEPLYGLASMDAEVMSVEKSTLVCRLPAAPGNGKRGWFVKFYPDPTPFQLMHKVRLYQRFAAAAACSPGSDSTRPCHPSPPPGVR